MFHHLLPNGIIPCPRLISPKISQLGAEQHMDLDQYIQFIAGSTVLYSDRDLIGGGGGGGGEEGKRKA